MGMTSENSTHMKTALITGASGLLGQLTNQSLIEQGYKTVGVKHRRATHTRLELGSLAELSQFANSKIDLVINLAGAPIAGGPWSKNRKQALLDSRVKFTTQLISTLKSHEINVGHFVSGSAIGFYGTGSDRVSEDSPVGADFSAQLCEQWEAAASDANELSDAVSFIRTGLVLSPKGGYLQPLKMTSQLGVGSVFGSGAQGQSWVHQADWLAALNFIIESKHSGAFNLTAPNPVTQRELMTSLTKALKRPLIFKIPAFALSLAGEMKTLFIDGQFVLPTRLEEAAFEFKYPTIDKALADLIG